MTREELQELFDEHDRIFGPPEDGLTKWRREVAEQEARFAREREKSRNLTDSEIARWRTYFEGLVASERAAAAELVRDEREFTHDLMAHVVAAGAGACAVPARGRPPAVSSAASPISRPGPSPAIPAWRKCAWSAGSNRNPTRALIARQRFTRIKNAKHSLASSTSWRVLLFTATTGGHEGRAKSRHSRRYLRRLSS